MKRRLAIAATITAALAFGGLTTRAGADPHRFRYSVNRPDVILSVETHRPMVALTFDDGPDPRFTPEALAILEAHGAHATFFDTGQHVWMYPDLARRTVAAGNEIGNHTCDHPMVTRLTQAAVAH